MKNLEKEIKELFQKYDNLYKLELIKSTNIEEYWENEFIWWKREAFQDILELIKSST